MSQNTANSTAFIEAQQYSQFILENLYDGMLPDGLTRDVSDFGSGTTLNVKTVGTVSIQDVVEDVPMAFSAIDSGTVTLSITDYIGNAWYITDELREDGSQVEQLSAAVASENLRAIQEAVETKFLAACNSAQTNAAANTINGVAHRVVSAETNNVAALSHFVALKLAFDKAGVPQGGRVAFVDPVVEATLNGLTNLVNVSNNPMFEGIVTEGFSREHKFLRNIFGFDIWTSNRLAKGSVGDGTTTVADGVANVFMCVSDDNTRPIMRAWRRMPKTEGWRDSENRRDNFQLSSRFGFGAQRVDTLAILGTSASSY